MTADLQFGLLRGTALRVEYHAPAVHGHERRPGYFEVRGKVQHYAASAGEHATPRDHDLAEQELLEDAQFPWRK